MPLMLVWTGWEMFGDTIKKWIGIDTEAEKRLEESIAKQKEYAETVGLAALSLKQVNEARLTGIGSIEEKIHYDTVELNAFKGHVEAYEKLVEEKKVAREKETLDSLKKDSKPGAVFSEEVFHLKQMAESERLTEKQKIRTLELADAVQKAENALSMAYGPGRVVAQTNLNNVLAITSLHTKDIYKNAEQNSAQNGKFQSSIELVTKAFEEQFKANTKLGDPSLGLNTEKAKNTYEGLATVLDSSMGATIKYEGVQRLLAKGIAAGGKTAAIATGMYKALAETQATASMFLLEGRISPEEFARRMESAFQDAKKGLLDLAFSMNDVKAPKAIKPYSDESKRQFKALQDDIDLITIKMKQLATEEKKDSALQARLKAINGIVSAEALANEKVYRDKQAQFTLDKEMGDAKLALEKVLQNKTNKGAEGKQAIEAAKAVYISKLQVLGLTKIELDTSGSF